MVGALSGVGDISMPKLRSLLDSALRASTAAQDPFADDLTCALLPYTLISQLLRVISVKHGRGGDGSAPAPVPVGHKGGVSGVEAFTFDYKVEWPLSIVLSSYALTKYQVTHQTTSLSSDSFLHSSLCLIPRREYSRPDCVV